MNCWSLWEWFFNNWVRYMNWWSSVGEKTLTCSCLKHFFFLSFLLNLDRMKIKWDQHWAKWQNLNFIMIDRFCFCNFYLFLSLTLKKKILNSFMIKFLIWLHLKFFCEIILFSLFIKVGNHFWEEHFRVKIFDIKHKFL